MTEILTECTIYLALLSFITGLFFYKKLPNNKARSLLCFLLFSFTLDYVGSHFKRWTGLANYPIYNLYILMSFCYYIILLKLLLVKTRNRQIAFISVIVFLTSYFTYFIFVQKNLASPFTYVFGIGVLLVLILSILYLLEIFNSDKILNFKKSIYFWFILGILVFHVSFLPYMLSSLFFLFEYNMTTFVIVLFILNLLMHICFLIGFICSSKEHNY